MKTKIIEGLKSQLVTLIVGAILVVIVFVKDVFKAGADVKAQETFMKFLQSEKAVKFTFNIADSAIDKTMNDPFVMLDILSSSHIENFAERKATEVTNVVEEKIRMQDSVNSSFLSTFAKALNIREDKAFDFLVDMGKAYERGRTRTVRGNF